MTDLFVDGKGRSINILDDYVVDASGKRFDYKNIESIDGGSSMFVADKDNLYESAAFVVMNDGGFRHLAVGRWGTANDGANVRRKISKAVHDWKRRNTNPETTLAE